MKILIGKTDLAEFLKKYQGEYCQISFRVDSKTFNAACGGEIQIIPDEMPYNPLTDMDCGTDAMITKEVK